MILVKNIKVQFADIGLKMRCRLLSLVQQCKMSSEKVLTGAEQYVVGL